MFDLSKNYNISRQLATGGMILLENKESVLPLDCTRRVGVVGKSCLDLIKGGRWLCCGYDRVYKVLGIRIGGKSKSRKVYVLQRIGFTC